MSAPNKTQEDCRKEFLIAVQDFVKKLSDINDSTPATPVEEPRWWGDMMQLLREAETVKENHKI